MGIVAAIIIPFALILVGATAKKLMRSSDWKGTDFFLGAELSLAALASGLTFALEVFRADQTSELSSKGVTAILFVAVCLALFLVVISLHQDWEKKPNNPRGQAIWMGCISNGIGGVLLASFIILVKGVS